MIVFVEYSLRFTRSENKNRCTKYTENGKCRWFHVYIILKLVIEIQSDGYYFWDVGKITEDCFFFLYEI